MKNFEQILGKILVKFYMWKIFDEIINEKTSLWGNYEKLFESFDNMIRKRGWGTVKTLVLEIHENEKASGIAILLVQCWVPFIIRGRVQKVHSRIF